MMMHEMKRRIGWLLLPLAAALFLGLALNHPATAETPRQGGNLLHNAGFEGEFSAWSGINEIQMANSWTPWWYENPNNNPALFRPEYKRAVASIYPNRVLSGESAQQYFTFYASHYAGMYQQVFNVTPGQRYRFSIWVQVWSSVDDNPYESNSPANPHLQIGIDPTGFWDPWSPNIVWSPEGSMDAIIDQWSEMSVEAAAQSDIVTVFVRTNPDFANKHNDMYYDNASLVAVGNPQPTQPPTATPGPPTNTPGPPTSTPEVTDTPIPSSTPVPTETPAPTDTPEPSDTPVPPTDTPVPTETPLPPTDTPVPADTAVPEPAASDTPAVVAANDGGSDNGEGENIAGETAGNTTTEADADAESGSPTILIILIVLLAGIVIGGGVVAAFMLLRRG